MSRWSAIRGDVTSELRSVLALCLVVATASTTGCGDDGTTADVGLDASDDVAVDATPDASDGGDADVVEGSAWLDRLVTDEDYAALEGEGREVKYLARLDGREPMLPYDCLFQNTARYPFHIQFLRGAFAEELGALDLDSYVSIVLRAASRRWWGGSLKRYDRITHPLSFYPGITTYTVYTQPGSGEDLTVDQIVEVDQRLKGCAPVFDSELVFVPSGDQQMAAVEPLIDDLNSRGVAVRFPVELIERDYSTYSAGESYGYLSIVPRGELPPEEYGPRDILVLEAAPTDITTVGGMITTLPQNIHSHVNLRLREKSLPNAMLATAYEDPRIVEYADQLVHVVTTDNELTIAPATLEAAQTWWDAHRPTVGEVHSDLSVTALEGIDTLEHSDALAYGVKAANLGELHRVLGPENRVEGFGVPFSAYDDFVTHNGIDAQVDALLADERLLTDRAWRVEQLDALRDLFKDGELQPGFFEALEARLREVYGDSAESMFIRFRSSTNAEDLEAFSGAGLYDSKTGCLGDDLDGDDEGPSHCLTAEHRAYIEAELAVRRAEYAANPDHIWLDAIIADLEDDLVDEKPVADAVRKVWRSLWNLRAFDEREYYGIDHTEVYMGLAVAPTFVMERQESVAITNLLPDNGDPLYRVISQVREVGVVRPTDPTAVPETLTFRSTSVGASDFRVVVPSSLSPGGARLWTDTELETLGALLIAVQRHFEDNVYPDIIDLQLDLEIEVTSDDRIVIKQARPYLGEQ
jgi:hypothetical protein